MLARTPRSLARFTSPLALLLLALTSVASATGCSASSASPDGPPASTSSDITVPLGGDVYESGVLTSRLVVTAAPETMGRQRRSNWCWAADLQTILRFHGLEVTQEQIVTRAFGDLLDRPQSPAAIAATVNGWTFSDAATGATAQVRAVASAMDALTIRSELENDRPPILGLSNEDGSGHAYILTSITYRVVSGPSGAGIVPLSVKLRDPWPDNPSSLAMSWQEVQSRFAGLVFIGVTTQP